MLARWGLVVAIALARMAFGYQFQSVATLAPELTRAYGLDYASLGTLIGLYLAPGIVTALPGGLLGRRYGEGLFFGIGLLLMIAGPLLAAMAQGLMLLGAGRVLAGTGAVLMTVLQAKMLADRFDGRMLFTAMSAVVGAFPVGVGLCGLLHAPIAGRFGWQGVMMGGSVLAALAFAVFMVAPRSATPTTRRWALPSRAECQRSAVAGLVWTAFNAGFGGFLSYVPSLLAARGRSPAATGLVLMLATWPNLPAMIAGGTLAGRWRENRVFLIGTLAMAVSVAGIALFGFPILWGIGFGTFAALHPGVIVARGTLAARPENRAVGMGVFYTVYYAGGAALPVICGRAADLAGTPAAALLTAAVLSLLALPAWWGLKRLA